MSLVDLDPQSLPQHVAIIMDGNGRWAERRGLPRVAGHRRGKESVRAIVEAARRLGIPYLSLYAFSSENWNRPNDEVSVLMNLLEHYLRAEVRKMMKHDIRLRAVGDLSRLPTKVQSALQYAIETTAENKKMTVMLAVSYGGRAEIAAAAKNLAEQVQRGELDPADIDEDRFAANLLTHGIPDPDLLIRTSGEMRVSNFLLWQIAYAELFVTPTLWPDFGEAEFLDALASFQRRDRRFGKTRQQLAKERIGASR